MSKLLGLSRYLALIAVIGSLLASVAAYIYGFIKVVNIILKLFATAFGDEVVTISFIELMDTFLIATALLIFAIGIYELFVGDLDMPEWLVIKDFNGLKIKLSGVIILVLAVTFLKHLVEWKDPQGTLFFGAAIAVVGAMLIAFNRAGNDH